MLRGDGHNDDLRIGDRLGAIAGGGHGIGQARDAWQAHVIAMVCVNAFDDFRFDGPHGHAVASICEHLPECGSPGSCSQHGDIGHATLLLADLNSDSY